MIVRRHISFSAPSQRGEAEPVEVELNSQFPSAVETVVRGRVMDVDLSAQGFLAFKYIPYVLVFCCCITHYHYFHSLKQCTFINLSFCGSWVEAWLSWVPGFTVSQDNTVCYLKTWLGKDNSPSSLRDLRGWKDAISCRLWDWGLQLFVGWWLEAALSSLVNFIKINKRLLWQDRSHCLV